MAALDFPSSPTLNQTYFSANGLTYRWNGASWLSENAGLNSTFYNPSGPTNGILLEDGSSFLMMEDGTSFLLLEA